MTTFTPFILNEMRKHQNITISIPYEHLEVLNNQRKIVLMHVACIEYSCIVYHFIGNHIFILPINIGF